MNTADASSASMDWVAVNLGSTMMMRKEEELEEEGSFVRDRK